MGNKFFTLELVLQGNLSDQFFRSARRNKSGKMLKKTAVTNPTFFMTQIRFPPGLMNRKKDFTERKKITNKTIKALKNAFVWAFIIQD